MTPRSLRLALAAALAGTACSGSAKNDAGSSSDANAADGGNGEDGRAGQGGAGGGGGQGGAAGTGGADASASEGPAGGDAPGGSDGRGDLPPDAVPGPSPGNTGAFGVVVVGGKQKLYLPNKFSDVVHVVDVGVPGAGVAGAPALITDIELGTNAHPGLSAGDASIVVVASIDAPQLWFIDPSTDTVTKPIALDATYKKTMFSLPLGYVNGIAVDSARRRAILAVWNGFAILDLDSGTVTRTVLAAPSENFGYDSASQRIYAPFYSCAMSGEGTPPPTCNDYKTTMGKVMTSGLNVIDLTDDTVYTFEDAAAKDPTQPLGLEPDSASIDPVVQTVLVPAEFSDQHVLDFSKAVFDKASKTVTAPHRIITMAQFDGVAAEPTSHLGFWEHEFEADVGVYALADAVAGTGTLLHGVMPDKPDTAFPAFHNPGDPHGVAVATAINGGKPVAFVVDWIFGWVGRVDLQTMVGLSHATPGMLTKEEMTPAVTYLDATTKP